MKILQEGDKIPLNKDKVMFGDKQNRKYVKMELEEKEGKTNIREEYQTAEFVNKLPINDDLKLKSIDISENNLSFMFPEELNRYQREKIRMLYDENGRLRRSLEECQAELKEATNKLRKHGIKEEMSLSPSMNGIRKVSDVAANKIVELSKQVRELTAEMESLKTKCKSQEAQIITLKNSDRDIQQTVSKKKTSSEDDEDQIKSLSDQLQCANGHLCESRNLVQQLKQELKVAHKVLKNEIGDESICIPSLLSGGSNWRGRAQEIINLKQKVLELQEQISQQSSQDNCKEKFAPGADSKLQQKLKNIVRERQVMHEKVEKDLHHAREQLEETRRKLDASRARIKVLEKELDADRGRITTLLQKGDHDNQLIMELTAQLAVQETRWNKKIEESSKAEEKLRQEKHELLENISNEKAKSSELQKDIEELKKQKVLLEQTIREIKANDFTEHHIIHNTNNEASCNVQTVTSTSTLTQDTQMDYNVLYVSAEAERVHLLELLDVVNKRLKNEREELDIVQNHLRRERQKTAKLESKITKLELEKTAAGRLTMYRDSRKPSEKCAIPEETARKIELLNEELQVTKTRLQCVQQEKEEDLKVYTELLQQARRHFLCAQNVSPTPSLCSVESSGRDKPTNKSQI